MKRNARVYFTETIRYEKKNWNETTIERIQFIYFFFYLFLFNSVKHVRTERRTHSSIKKITANIDGDSYTRRPCDTQFCSSKIVHQNFSFWFFFTRFLFFSSSSSRLYIFSALDFLSHYYFVYFVCAGGGVCAFFFICSPLALEKHTHDFIWKVFTPEVYLLA